MRLTRSGNNDVQSIADLGTQQPFFAEHVCNSIYPVSLLNSWLVRLIRIVPWTSRIIENCAVGSALVRAGKLDNGELDCSNKCNGVIKRNL